MPRPVHTATGAVPVYDDREVDMLGGGYAHNTPFMGQKNGPPTKW